MVTAAAELAMVQSEVDRLLPIRDTACAWLAAANRAYLLNLLLSGSVARLEVKDQALINSLDALRKAGK